METVSCNLCGSSVLNYCYSMPDRYYFPDEMFDVVECSSCGLAFVSPRPSESEIQKYYPKEFYNVFITQEHRYEAEVAFLKKMYAEDCWGKGRMLDVGTANGDFPLRLRKEGWEVEGVEVSPNNNQHDDILIYNCPLPNIPISEHYYDLVTAWAVFEHLHDPMSYFKKVGEILKPGGLFVFLVTNWNSVASRYLMQEDIPRHLYFYSENTVSKYLDVCGLNLIHHETNGNIFNETALNYVPWLVRRALGLGYRWEDIPETRGNFMNRLNFRKNVLTNALFALRHPLVVADRLLEPFITKAHVLNKKYGISIYLACKGRYSCG